MAGKKKKGKKSSDELVETVTLKEAVMTCQFEVKQSQLNNVKKEIDDLKYRNEEQKKKNQFLKKEQNRHIKDVINQVRQKEGEMRIEDQTPFESVEKALHEKRTTLLVEQASLEDIKKKIASLNENIEESSKELSELINYKEHGQMVNKTHIELLKKDLEAMEGYYAEMIGFFQKSFDSVKMRIIKQNEEDIAIQKKLASEGVIEMLDKYTEQELLDNKWLHEEVDINRRHVGAIEKEVEMLEKFNIGIMSDLFAKQLDDFNQIRKFYLACKKEDEIEKLKYNENNSSVAENSDGNFQGDGGSTGELRDDLKWIDEYLPIYEERASEDVYRLCPIEIKLLCVTGKKIVLHELNDTFSSIKDEHIIGCWNRFTGTGEMKCTPSNDSV